MRSEKKQQVPPLRWAKFIPSIAGQPNAGVSVPAVIGRAERPVVQNPDYIGSCGVVFRGVM